MTIFLAKTRNGWEFHRFLNNRKTKKGTKVLKLVIMAIFLALIAAVVSGHFVVLPFQKDRDKKEVECFLSKENPCKFRVELFYMVSRFDNKINRLY